MKISALIPARGESKRIPYKNIRLLGGKPLIQWSIEAAQALELDCYVSTESQFVKKVAWSAGARVINRPPELATDESGDAEVILHAFSQVDADLLVYLRPTTPFRVLDDVRRAIKVMETVDYSSLRSVELMPESCEKCFYLKDELLLPVTEEDRTDWPNQICRPSYHPNGVVDIVRRSVARPGDLWGPRKYGLVTEPVVELDTESQWQYAEWRLSPQGCET